MYMNLVSFLFGKKKKKKKDMSSHNLADHNSGDLNATTVEQQMGPPEGILPKVQQMNFTDAHSRFHIIVIFRMKKV